MMIDSFRGEYFFLSNFYPAEVYWLGMNFPTVEHAYQAAKKCDLDHMQAIRHCATPAEAKRVGAMCELRKDWELVKLPIMEALLRRKFNGSDDLRKRLLATGDAKLVEGNTWGDTYWGICSGVGRNELGKAIMKVRDWLRENHDE